MLYAANNHDPAKERWREGLSVSLREGDTLAEGYARSGLELSNLVRGDHEAAAARFAEALPLLEAYGDPLSSLARVWLGTTSLMRGDAARAEQEIGEGLASARYRGDTLCTYVALYNLAQLATSRSRPARSRRAWGSQGTPKTGRTSRTSWTRSRRSPRCAGRRGARRS